MLSIVTLGIIKTRYLLFFFKIFLLFVRRFELVLVKRIFFANVGSVVIFRSELQRLGPVFLKNLKWYKKSCVSFILNKSRDYRKFHGAKKGESLGLKCNQFGIIQVLQRFPILQTNNWSETFFCCFLQKTGQTPETIDFTPP